MSIPDLGFVLAVLVSLILGFSAGWFARQRNIRPLQVHPQPGDVSYSGNKYWLALRSKPGYYGMQSQQDADGAAALAGKARPTDSDVLWEGHPSGASGANRIFFDRVAQQATPPDIGRQIKPVLTSDSTNLPTVSWTHGGNQSQSITLDAASAARLLECLEAVQNVSTNCTSIAVTSRRVYLELTLPHGYLTARP